MPLLAHVAARLRDRETSFALIGAAALAVHGVARSTLDIDVLVLDASCLDRSYWEPLRDAGIDVAVRPGAPDDPLGGVVRVRTASETVDVVVGRPGWQRRVLSGATTAEVDGIAVPVARAVDLALLKLYAGGPQDAWDVQQLVSVGAADVAEVDARAADLPEDARALWQRIRPAP